MAAQSDPLQVQIPAYPSQVGRDLPTARDVPFDFSNDEDLFVILQIPPFEGGDEWTRDTLRADDRLVPFVRVPANSCYRNAALAALLNLPPVINFLRIVSLTRHDQNRVLPRLAALALVWRSPDEGQTEGQVGLRNLMQSFWAQVARPAEALGPRSKSLAGYNSRQATDMDDPSNFIMYLFDRIAGYDLSLDQLDPSSGVRMIDMFQRLFQSDMIARSPFNCQCGAIKRRQRVFNMGYMMEANLERSRRLEGLIAENLYDVIRQKETPQCSVCGALTSAKAEFFKYAYLPEVLMFSTSYVRDSGDKTAGAAWTNVFKAQLTYPEILDMSNVRDDPGRQADRNCLYRLQSIVVSPNMATPMSEPGISFAGVHFMAYLRRNETTWTLVDDLRQDTLEFDIEAIRNHPYRPRLLMYVRVHPAENQAEGDTNDNSQRDAAGDSSKSELPDTTMEPSSENSAPKDDGLDSSAPKGTKGNENPPKVTSPKVKNKDAAPAAGSSDTQPQPKVTPPPENDTETQPPPKTDNPPAGGALGPLDGDTNLYPPVKDLPPGQLMRIIRASGARRDASGRGSRKLLGGVQRAARPSIATRLAMSTRAGSRRIQQGKRMK